MDEKFDLTVLALAGVCQSAHLVQQLAYHGRCDEKALAFSLSNLTHTSPEQAIEVLADKHKDLIPGLESVVDLLIQKSQQLATKEITRYALNLLILERKLSGKKTVLTEFYRRIQQLSRQRQFYIDSPVQLIHAMAGIYTDLISPLGPRIQVTGEQSLLQNSHMQSKIRALLLCGLYSAIWWRTLNGNRLQLIFRRQKIINHTQQILSSLNADE